VPKSKKPGPPKRVERPKQPLGILELERFTASTLNRWHALSQDLDELHAVLFFGVQPEQRRLRQALIIALQGVKPVTHSLTQWVRIVTYQYSLEPLSCAGSLRDIGGRFNAGAELDDGTLKPWPALYIAENLETAFREKFQLTQTDSVDGLTPQELALEHGVSHTTVFVKGQLHSVFDMTGSRSLEAVAQVLRRIKMPQRARQLKTKLAIPVGALTMVQTGAQLHDVALKHNWRLQPVQFGLPAPSHTLADLIRAAGFEAILYRSTKGSGKCLAVFPDLLASGSFIELSDQPPTAQTHLRLDDNSADELAGWDTLPSQLRPV
jgi:RES domain-containing protein